MNKLLYTVVFIFLFVTCTITRTFADSTVSFSFTPQTANVSQNGTVDIAVSLDSHSNAITGVDAQVMYDPAVLQFVTFIPATTSSTYPTVLTTIRQDNTTTPNAFRFVEIEQINNGQAPDIIGNAIPLGILRFKGIGSASSQSSLGINSSTVIITGKSDQSFTSTNNGASSVTIGTSVQPSDVPAGSFPLSLALDGIGISGDNQNPSSGGNPTPQTPVKDITVSLYNAYGALLQSKTITGGLTYVPLTDADTVNRGRYKATIVFDTPVVAGQYIIKAKTDRYLTKQIPANGTIAYDPNANASVYQTTLVTGDANNDNTLDILDYNILLDCYSDLNPPKNCSDPTKKRMADFNDDGNVNQIDYTLFLRELSVRAGD